MSEGCECFAANRNFLEEKWHKQEYFYCSVGGGLCYGGANLSLLMRNFRVRRVAPSRPVYLPVCVMHWRAFRGCCLRMESEVGESGWALMDGLRGGDRLDFWWAAALQRVKRVRGNNRPTNVCLYKGVENVVACPETILPCSRALISTLTKSHKTSRKPKRYPPFVDTIPHDYCFGFIMQSVRHQHCKNSCQHKHKPTIPPSL